MTQEALTLALEALYPIAHNTTDDPRGQAYKAITAIKEALAQQEQEPVAYLCENAVGHKYFRWKKPSSTYKPIALYTTPPQRTERPVDCERCNRLEEQAYDLVGKLRVANIKLSMQPQRTWQGLTDEEIMQIWGGIIKYAPSEMRIKDFARAIESKMKEINT